MPPQLPPGTPAWLETRIAVLRRAGWFYPAYFSNRAVGEAVKALEGGQALTPLLERLYTPAHLAAMLHYRYRCLPWLGPSQHTIAESIEASQMGLNHIAVAGLLPVVEGVLRRVAAANGEPIGDKQITARLKKTLGNLIATEAARYGGRTDGKERAAMLAAFLDFFETELWANTSKLKEGQLSRHGILHSVFMDGEFNGADNFYKLISFLDLLAFVGTYHTTGVSIMAPEVTAESNRTALYWVALRGVVGKLRPYALE